LCVYNSCRCLKAVRRECQYDNNALCSISARVCVVVMMAVGSYWKITLLFGESAPPSRHIFLIRIYRVVPSRAPYRQWRLCSGARGELRLLYKNLRGITRAASVLRPSTSGHGVLLTLPQCRRRRADYTFTQKKAFRVLCILSFSHFQHPIEPAKDYNIIACICHTYFRTANNNNIMLHCCGQLYTILYHSYSGIIMYRVYV